MMLTPKSYGLQRHICVVLIMKGLKNCNIAFFIRPQTFQSEDAISQGIHNVVEGGFISHIEKVFVVGVAGDVLDLSNESLRVLLPPDVMTKNLERSVRNREKHPLKRENTVNE